MAKTFLKASQIGEYARERLNEEKKGKVAGVTSKGIFFLFGRYSLFLTRSTFLSPFNISIGDHQSIPDTLQTGDDVYYSIGDLLIPDRQITIALDEAEVWIPPAAVPGKANQNTRVDRMRYVLQQLNEQYPKKGFLFLNNPEEELSDSEQTIQDAASAFRGAFFALQKEKCLAAADQLFGLGGGLTPSGDDLITGFVLFQARLIGTNSFTEDYLKQMGDMLVQEAYRRTTWISANRLEAACKGWSEELFLKLIDYVNGNQTDVNEEMIQTLYEFGHSSGVDTTMGIALGAGALL